MPPDSAPPPETPKPARSLHPNALLFWLVGAAAILIAFWGAWHRRWVSDDAFISFRYAENLVRGLGLVFNQGERVEGYSNFLWTVWTALGMRLGADPERWSMGTGLLCYTAALGALIWNAWTMRRDATGPVRWIPVAALLAALTADWQFYATSGLETSLFTLEIVLVYVALAHGALGRWRVAAAGALLALVSMTRPDGPVFAAAAAVYVFLADTRRPRACIVLGAAFFALWGPYTAWRVLYYGDFFPNTYYAKSASHAWYSQGLVYIALYFARYWPLLLGLLLVVLAWRRARRGQPLLVLSEPWTRRAVLAALLALAYTAYVVRVGGDFMFGRFLIPATPLLLVLLELGLMRVPAGAAARWLLVGVVTAGIVFTPYPLPRDPFGVVRGIVFEPNYYGGRKTERIRREGLTLRRYFEGLPVRLAFFGGEARLAYYARPAVAIECSTGLTDRAIARQPIQKRTRVGHEKLASTGYLIDVRRAHFTFFWNAVPVLRLDRAIPHVEIDFGGVRGRVLTWDPALMDSLRLRGAVFTDFPAELDRLVEEPSRELKWGGWPNYLKLRRFYFANVNDPGREALVIQRIHEGEALP